MTLFQTIIAFTLTYGGMIVFLIGLIANIVALCAIKRDRISRARKWIKLNVWVMILWLVTFFGIIGWSWYNAHQMQAAMMQQQIPVEEQALPAPAAAAPVATPDAAAPAAEVKPEAAPETPAAK